MNIKDEFDRQVENLLKKGYPEAAGMSEEKFTGIISPLKDSLCAGVIPEKDLDKGILPFVLVIKSSLVPLEKMIVLINREGKRGIISMSPVAPPDFQPTGKVDIPVSLAYLAVDIDRGEETLNVRPKDALPAIWKKNRSPLTIDEGLAILTHYPDFLKKNHCFSLLASRRNDKRVPALWISEGRPKLGWCWDGNPHTWLGSASCRCRINA
jgi:hypothetical protein